MEINNRQRAIIIGSILGDGTIEKRWQYPRLRFGHGISQKEYIFWKYDEFRNIANQSPTYVEEWHKVMGKKYGSWHFGTKGTPELIMFWNDFYQNKHKIVPMHIKKILIDPLSIAVWFMDDGYKRNDCNAFRLNTDAFSLNDQQLLQAAVEENFGIPTKLHKKGKYRNIYIPESSSKKFVELVKRYIVPSMEYKIALAPVTTGVSLLENKDSTESRYYNTLTPLKFKRVKI